MLGLTLALLHLALLSLSFLLREAAGIIDLRVWAHNINHVRIGVIFLTFIGPIFLYQHPQSILLLFLLARAFLHFLELVDECDVLEVDSAPLLLFRLLSVLDQLPILIVPIG